MTNATPAHAKPELEILKQLIKRAVSILFLLSKQERNQFIERLSRVFPYIMHDGIESNGRLFPVDSGLCHHKVHHIHDRRPVNMQFPFHESNFDYPQSIQKHAIMILNYLINGGVRLVDIFHQKRSGFYNIRKYPVKNTNYNVRGINFEV